MGDDFRHEDRCAHRDAICLCPVVQARDARISELETESTAYLERAAAWSKEWQAENARAIIAEKKLSASEARVASLEAALATEHALSFRAQVAKMDAENAALREKLVVAIHERDYYEKKWMDLEGNRADCCMKMEDNLKVAEGKLAALQAAARALCGKIDHVQFDGMTFHRCPACGSPNDLSQPHEAKCLLEKLHALSPATASDNE